MLLAPISAVAVTLFMLGLPFGREVGWSAQQRDAEGVPFLMAARRLWLQTLLGVVFGLWFWNKVPGAVWLWAPFVLGLAGSIPLAMLTASPRLGRALAAVGLCRIPEEAGLPAEPEYAELFAPPASPPALAASSAGAAK